MAFNLKQSIELDAKYDKYLKAFQEDALLIFELLRKLLELQMVLEATINNDNVEVAAIKVIKTLFFLFDPIVRHVCDVTDDEFASRLLDDIKEEAIAAPAFQSFDIAKNILEEHDLMTKKASNAT